MVKKKISYAQHRRLYLIDLFLFLKGDIDRADLVNSVGITAAQASKDIAAYKQMAPYNIVYNSSLKKNLRAKTYVPAFDYDADEILRLISTGWQPDSTVERYRPWPVVRNKRLNTPSLDIVRRLAHAIFHCQVVVIKYVSHNTGVTEREIVPHSFVDDGFRWHVRAYDRKNEDFRDFLLPRTLEVSMLEEEPRENELKEADIIWKTPVTFTLVPHPNLKHKELALQEYKLKDGSRTETVTEALFGYWLRYWRVDATIGHTKEAEEFPLALQNPEQYQDLATYVVAIGPNSKSNG